ncbi:uncharacterized protein LOC135813060 [Sycon ciliatum]|uniref:uncharacterized protein LOC135813060 n=1 Tax=Sycon ciliatum TaxID=27933 RepID=UPI0031F667B1
MAKLTPPADFDFSIPVAWPAWKRWFAGYRLASELNSKDEKVQISMLLYWLAPEAETDLDQLAFEAVGDKDKHDKVLTKLDAYFKPALNMFHQMTIFQQCDHLPGESVEEFVRKLHAIAKFCDFGDQKDNRVRDRLVAHILDRQVAKELQQIEPAKLTLTGAVLRARQAEKISGDVEAQAARPQVNAASRFGGKQQDAKSRLQCSGIPSKPAPTPAMQRKSGTTSSTSLWCGHAGSHKSNRSACPAFCRKCNSCGKKGHFAAVCPWCQSCRK